MKQNLTILRELREMGKDKLFLLFVSVACVSSCSYINSKMHLKDDNIIEEMAEELLKQKTGFDLDFTPESVE